MKFNIREHVKLHDNVQEETKNTTFNKSSEQIVQMQKLWYDVLKLRFQTKKV